MKTPAKHAVAKRTGTALAGKAAATLDLTVAIREITGAVHDYMVTRDRERTRRVAIAAAERTAIARIESQRALICQALDRAFDERSVVFDGLLRNLDTALAQGDTGSVAALTGAMTRLAAENPFVHLGATLAAQAADPDHVFEL
jgi:hypothetical protein